MSFRIQDLMKIIIPGTLSLFFATLLVLSYENYVWLVNNIKDIVGIFLVLFFIICYGFGYFIDFFGSILEKIYYKFKFKPSYYLINDIGKYIRLSKREEVLEELCLRMSRCTTNLYSSKEAEDIFKFANILKDKSQNSNNRDRLREYYFSMVFSRNLSSGFIVSLVLYLIYFIFNNATVMFNCYSLMLFLPFIICVIRWKQHASYYSRQVFYVACENIFKI